MSLPKKVISLAVGCSLTILVLAGSASATGGKKVSSDRPLSGSAGVSYRCRTGSLTYDIIVDADSSSATVTSSDSHAVNPQASTVVGSPCSALITKQSLAITCNGHPGYSLLIDTSSGEWADGHFNSPGALSGTSRHGGDDSDDLCKRL